MAALLVPGTAGPTSLLAVVGGAPPSRSTRPLASLASPGRCFPGWQLAAASGTACLAAQGLLQRQSHRRDSCQRERRRHRGIVRLRASNEIELSSSSNAIEARRRLQGEEKIQLGLTQEQKMARKLRAEMVQETIDKCSPVPQSFEQAVRWACSASLEAIKDGRLRHEMYFNTGSQDVRIDGDLGASVQFGEAVASTFAEAIDKLPKGGDGTVRVVFPDMGARACVAQQWSGLPENVILDHFPPILPLSDVKPDEEMKLQAMLDASMIIVVAPLQTELGCVFALMDRVNSLPRKMPVIFMNARLIQDRTVIAGERTRLYTELEKTITSVFHLEQYDPKPDKEEIMLNSAVVVRVWPRPYSTWEDNPEDPESIDGYFLMEVDDKRAPELNEVHSMLEGSRKLRKRMRQKERLEQDQGLRDVEGRLIPNIDVNAGAGWATPGEPLRSSFD
eukprot:TRINITY_DN28895_c0_g1_i1.p1 TRINITY_DN28895_c0_g1~~TRINITY_DN28895_c0_g1_i1.p1  ORF type:complete len:448 (+),score=82.10 TRINITY_DN28895_c0_g1_i1:75-1418(+)